MRRVQDATEARPDVFIRYDYPERLNKSRAAVSKLLNVDVDEVVCKLYAFSTDAMSCKSGVYK